MTPLTKANFALTTYASPALNEVNFGLSIYAPSLDGDDFALTQHTPPALNAVNFGLVNILGAPISQAFNKLAYASEPPSSGWNKLLYESEPPVSGAWNKIKYG